MRCVVDGEMGKNCRGSNSNWHCHFRTYLVSIRLQRRSAVHWKRKSQAARFEPSLFVVWLRLVEVAHRCSRLRADRSWDPIRGWDE